MSTIISSDLENEKAAISSFDAFFKTYRIGSFLKRAHAYKSKGIPVLLLFRILFEQVFFTRSLHMTFLQNPVSIPCKKDTLYRFLHSIHTNWILFTTALSNQIIQKTLLPLTPADRKNVLIIDDSFFSRERSKKVELLSNVYDHTDHRYKRGYRMLTVGWSDGNTYLPINQVLLSSQDAKNRYQEAQPVDQRTAGGKRRQLAITPAPQVVNTLLEITKKEKIPAQYVLFDSWFTNPSSLIAIRKIGYDVVGMLKKSKTIHLIHNGTAKTLMEIYKQSRKRPGRSRYLLTAEVTVQKGKESCPARLVYVRNRNKRSEYLCLICTDMTLTCEEVIQLYGRRWEIEVFFKYCKSYLHLAKECRSLSYDAITAHTAIVFTRYMFLAVENRKQKDPRTLGELFYLLHDEMQVITFSEVLSIFMSLLKEALQESCFLSQKQIDQLLDLFMDHLPNLFLTLLHPTA